FFACRTQLHEQIKVDAGADAFRLQQIHQIFGADVAGMAAAVLHLGRVPPHAAQRAVVVAHPHFVGSQAVHQAGAAGVMKMGNRVNLGEGGNGRSKQRLHLLGGGGAGGVTQGDVVHTQVGKAFNVFQHRVGSNVTFERTAECHGDRTD